MVEALRIRRVAAVPIHPARCANAADAERGRPQRVAGCLSSPAGACKVVLQAVRHAAALVCMCRVACLVARLAHRIRVGANADTATATFTLIAVSIRLAPDATVRLTRGAVSADRKTSNARGIVTAAALSSRAGLGGVRVASSVAARGTLPTRGGVRGRATTVTAESIVAAVRIDSAPTRAVDALEVLAAGRAVTANAAGRCSVSRVEAGVGPGAADDATATAVLNRAQGPTPTIAATLPLSTDSVAPPAVQRISGEVEVLVDTAVAVIVLAVAQFGPGHHFTHARGVDAVVANAKTGTTRAPCAERARVGAVAWLVERIGEPIAVVVQSVTRLGLGRHRAQALAQRAIDARPLAVRTGPDASLSRVELPAGHGRPFVHAAVAVVVQAITRLGGGRGGALARSPEARRLAGRSAGATRTRVREVRWARSLG